MMIIMNDTYTINVPQHLLMSSIMIANVMLQFGASLTDESRVVIYDHNMSIIQATG